jgi:pyridoxal phosphate enzyme (YggS family)
MIVENLSKIKSEIPAKVKLVAVSKTKPGEAVMEAYNAGQRIFGENVVQEMTRKYNELPKDIEWHMIGHLQSNKVKYIVPFVSLIHSVDSLKLLQIIDKEAAKNNRTINCLLQVYIADEETKFGFDEAEIRSMLQSGIHNSLHNVRILGLMGIATYTDDENKIRNEFRKLANIFKSTKAEFFPNSNEFKELSMGMSSDYEIAIDEGSTMIRIGSSIFGERDYSKS